MNTDTLTQFLNLTNKSTYANKDAPKAASLRPSSYDYHFEEGELVYHDTYFGARDFIGEEIVYESDKPVWGSNYFGFVLDEEVSEKDVYNFLRHALMQERAGDLPVRGPAQFIDSDNEYRFTVEGDLSNFRGTEEILFNGEVVYRCYIHGGMIK